jgi:hypothetical protein
MISFTAGPARRRRNDPPAGMRGVEAILERSGQISTLGRG